MALDPLLDPPCVVEGPKRRLVDPPCSTPSERSEAVESGDMASTLPAQNCSSSSFGEAPSCRRMIRPEVASARSSSAPGPSSAPSSNGACKTSTPIERRGRRTCRAVGPVRRSAGECVQIGSSAASD